MLVNLKIIVWRVYPNEMGKYVHKELIKIFSRLNRILWSMINKYYPIGC